MPCIQTKEVTKWYATVLASLLAISVANENVVRSYCRVKMYTFPLYMQVSDPTTSINTHSKGSDAFVLITIGCLVLIISGGSYSNLGDRCHYDNNHDNDDDVYNSGTAAFTTRRRNDTGFLLTISIWWQLTWRRVRNKRCVRSISRFW